MKRMKEMICTAVGAVGGAVAATWYAMWMMTRQMMTI